MTLRSPQTGPEGKLVRKVCVEAGSDIARELYLAIVVDRERERLTVIASTEGGMEIEEVAAHSPEKILSIPIDPCAGLMPYQVRQIGFGLGLSEGPAKQLEAFLGGLCGSSSRRTRRRSRSTRWS